MTLADLIRFAREAGADEAAVVRIQTSDGDVDIDPDGTDIGDRGLGRSVGWCLRLAPRVRPDLPAARRALEEAQRAVDAARVALGSTAGRP